MMTKDEAITLHLKHWEKFPVFVWVEGDEYVTEVDGQVIRAQSPWQLDTKLDGVAPQPRNLYLVDYPDYETSGPNAKSEPTSAALSREVG
jgi:hypothetical protein